jgi:IS1 family transposase
MANNLKKEKQLTIISMLVEGNSIRSIERMTGVHRNTIMNLGVRVGEACQKLMNEKIHSVNCEDLQADEIWTFVQKKQRRLTENEKRYSRELGDQYVFVAIDRKTKFVPSFCVGKRDTETAKQFAFDLKSRLNGTRPQLSTDGFDSYVNAIEDAFGADIDYAQLIKVFEAEHPGRGRYSPPKVSDTIQKVITGEPDEDRICTSHVERQNLTMRMQMRRFTRLTNAFSKKFRNLKAAVALHFAHYNYCRVHRSLRVTPAMEIGIADHVWSLDELLSYAMN